MVLIYRRIVFDWIMNVNSKLNMRKLSKDALVMFLCSEEALDMVLNKVGWWKHCRSCFNGSSTRVDRRATHVCGLVLLPTTFCISMKFRASLV